MEDIPIHPLTQNPTEAWKEISKTQRVIKVTMEPPQQKVAFDKARVVCISDTHSQTKNIKFDIPDGDILIHAGDFTRSGQLEDVVEFNQWLGTLPHKQKIVIAGNHELSFDETCTHYLKNIAHAERTKPMAFSLLKYLSNLGNTKKNMPDAEQTPNIRDVLSNCTYIEDDLIEIWGLRIYGSPWQPEFGKWAFNVPRGPACLEKWNKIPADIDILITHGPPLGHGDLCGMGVRAGCVELLTTIQKRVKPKYHVFGHIHEGYGVTSDDCGVFYVNASTCDVSYVPTNPPIVFDLALPLGVSKDD